MRKLMLLGLLICLSMGVGCASVVSLVNNGGIDQEVFFTSDPPGVELYSFGTYKLGETPLTVPLERVKHTQIMAKKEGFDDQTIYVKDHFNYWFWGNIICCGLLGSTTDFASGAVVEFDPDEYFITMKQKNASLEERNFQKAKMEARNFILSSYAQIGKDLVAGGGEYLSSLYKYLGIEDQSFQSPSYNKLKNIYMDSKNIPDFAQTILEHYYRRTA